MRDAARRGARKSIDFIQIAAALDLTHRVDDQKITPQRNIDIAGVPERGIDFHRLVAFGRFHVHRLNIAVAKGRVLDLNKKERPDAAGHKHIHALFIFGAAQNGFKK